MREIRLSGSEGGGAELNQPSLPLSVSVRCSQVPSIRARPDEAPRSQEGMAWRRVGALSFRLAASGQTHFVYLSGT